MNNKGLAEERDAVDLVTDCMYSVDFLTTFTDVLFGDNKGRASAAELYNAWLKVRGDTSTYYSL